MPIDVITLKAIATELNESISGGRIEKIYQPEVDEVTFFIKKASCVRQLVVSANPSHPRMHLSSQKKENALNAPAFCMLLRKHLIGCAVRSVGIFNCDRIIKVELEGKSELKDNKKFFLICELMGRYSNIILTTDTLLIIDAVRRIHFDQSTTRYILPNLPYVFQPQTRTTFNQKEELMRFFSETTELSSELLLKNISGIGKESALEIEKAECPEKKLFELIDSNAQPTYRPSLLYKNGKPKDFFVYPYHTVTGEWETYPTLNEALDVYYTNYDGEDRKKASAKTVTTILKRLQSKTDRRIQDNENKLKEWEKAEAIRRKGEFITCYHYLIKPRDTVLICSDYYENKEISIDIDSNLTPSQNAQVYYKKYNKLKRTKEIAEKQLEELYQQRDYLTGLAVAVENCSLKLEFEEILNELNQIGGFAKKDVKKNKVKPSAPTHIVLDGLDVYYGKNNVQNAQVTFDIGDSGDIWMHTKNHHGAHLIIKGQPSEETLLKCARIVAYYSEARESSKVEVDYTKRKFVKKIPSSLPGLVTYTEYKTILCEPSLPQE